MSGRGSTVSKRYRPTTNEKPSETMFQRVLLDFVLKTFGLGAENETRTRDPNLGKVVLYQLSYFRRMFRTCNRFYRIASAKIEQNFISPKFLKKKFSFFLVFFAQNFAHNPELATYQQNSSFEEKSLFLPSHQPSSEANHSHAQHKAQRHIQNHHGPMAGLQEHIHIVGK